MILYHGSNIDIQKIDLSKSKPELAITKLKKL